MPETKEVFLCSKCKGPVEFVDRDMLKSEEGFIEREIYYCERCDETISIDLTYPTGWNYAVRFMKELNISPEECVEIITDYKEANKFKPKGEG